MKMFLTVILVILSASIFAFAENQARQFRGPNGQGIYENETALTRWTDANIKWSVDLPGSGNASPVMWDDTIFAVAADDENNRYHILAVHSMDGEILWQKDFPFQEYKIRTESSFATSTPVVDANAVVAVYVDQKKMTVVALSHDGDLKWTFQTDGVVSRHGFGMSPILVQNKVILTREQEDVADSPFKSSWLALDVNTGKLVWEIERQTGGNNSFSTPAVTTLADKNYIIFTSEDGFTAVDPDDGMIAWEIDLFTMRTVTMPVFFNDLIIASCKGKSYAVKTNGLNTPEIAYELESKYSPYCPSPLIKDGLLYNFMDNGYISCHEVDTGELLWRDKPAGDFMGSPIWIDGYLYATTTAAEVVVIHAAKSYDLVAVNSLPEATQSTPIVANGALFIQTYSKLIAVGK